MNGRAAVCWRLHAFTGRQLGSGLACKLRWCCNTPAGAKATGLAEPLLCSHASSGCNACTEAPTKMPTLLSAKPPEHCPPPLRNPAVCLSQACRPEPSWFSCPQAELAHLRQGQESSRRLKATQKPAPAAGSLADDSSQAGASLACSAVSSPRARGQGGRQLT